MSMASAIETLRVRNAARALVVLIVLMGAGAAHASEPTAIAYPGPAHGCAAFEAGLVQSPHPSARIALAECYAQHGRTASAWSQYREAAASARDLGDAELEAQARTRAKALEPDLSYLTVHTWKGQDVLVTYDGSPIDAAVLGTAIPLDPGRHVIQAAAPGKRGWSKQIELGSHGDHVTVSVPVLPDDVELLSSELAASPAALPASEMRPNEGGSLQRTLALVAGAIGIAGVATGTLFGVKAASDWSDAKAQCQPYPYCGDDGARLAQDAKESALISTLGFATGLVGLSGGALLWFTAESPQAPALSVGVGRVQLRGHL